MIKFFNGSYTGLVLILLALVLGGCQSAATLSVAVRTGDTFIVGLSGEPEAFVTNTSAEVLRAADLAATITDSNGASAPVRVRSVFRVYGDPTATELAANLGQWIAVIDLVDTADNPLDLGTGAATLTITSPKLVTPLSVSTTILAGAGSPHPLLGKENSFEKLVYLQPAQQALVSVTGAADDTLVGAVQLDFHVEQVATPTAFGPLSAIDAIKLQGRRDISYDSWITENPEGGTDLTVVMTAPTGVATADLYHFNLALTAGLIGQAEEPASYFAGSLEQARFYNLDGEELNGLQATVGAVQ